MDIIVYRTVASLPALDNEVNLLAIQRISPCSHSPCPTSNLEPAVYTLASNFNLNGETKVDECSMTVVDVDFKDGTRSDTQVLVSFTRENLGREPLSCAWRSLDEVDFPLVDNHRDNSPWPHPQCQAQRDFQKEQYIVSLTPC